jgi:hypothetical protein
MSRKWLWLSLAGSAALAAVGFVLVVPRSQAGPNKEAVEEQAARVQLPIGQVVLFSSGVGYFQRAGAVEGNARVDLSFPVADINDLIKSMVLRDLDGGHVAAVSYESNAPIDRTLKSFAVNLTGNPTFSQILNQARGEKVEVTLQQAAAGQPAALSGSVVGVEKQKQAVGGKDTVEIEQLNLWCTDGMRSVKLADVQRVRFLNPVMETEFRKALETLSLSHDTQKKAVSISFQGEGKRQVRVGYVVENPIWKTSYRLVLGKEKEEKPFLQGWAVVENPTDEDWKDVGMVLVSGRPISFQMDLYTPLYVNRPVVEPELFASLRPVAYSGALEGKDADEERAAVDQGYRGRRGESKQAPKKDALRKAPSAPGAPPVLAGGMPTDGTNALGLKRQLEEQMHLEGSGVAAAAMASKLGDFFQYAIDHPVSLPRQKSALLPIVNKAVEGTRVSIYNERTQAKFPLLGLKFKNTSGLHLMQGPITVFEGSNYAGDARILDLQPDEERLLSYAIDLGTEVNPVPSTDNGRIIEVKAVKGVLRTTTKLRETKTYTIKNRNDRERLVLVEHPVRNDFPLADTPKPAKTASDFYRFEVKVAPGKTEKLTVTEEKTFGQAVQLSNSSDDQVRFFLTQPAVSKKVKEGLQRALELRWQLEKTRREIGELQRQLQTITEDQARVRANIDKVPVNSDVHKRYVKKFDEQETQIEKYQTDIKTLQGTEFSQKKAFEDFLAGFSAD